MSEDKKMKTTFHALSAAPAMTTEMTVEPDLDTARVSSIAKPQKAFAVAFAVLATALAGCASGLGANTYDAAAIGQIAHVDEGTVISQSIDTSAGSQQGFAYTIRLPSGELVSVAQAGEYAIPVGTPVLVQYGAHARVIPQQNS